MPVQTRSMSKLSMSEPSTTSQDCIKLMRKILQNKLGLKGTSSWYYTSYMDTFMDAYYTWEEITLEEMHLKTPTLMTRYTIMCDFVKMQYAIKNI